MDTRSGRIDDYEELKKDSDAKPTPLTPEEYAAMHAVDPADRPRQLALHRFKESCREKGYTASLAQVNAFNLGYRAGRSDA